VRAPISLVYVPEPRGCLGRIFDAIVIVAIIALTARYARRQEIACEWRGATASCTTSIVSAFGRRSTSLIEGIHSFAYRSGEKIGVVTDARNKDEKASFGTREIETWDAASADAIESFADQRKKSVAIAHGPTHPIAITIVAMLAVLGYAWITRPHALLVTIDPTSIVIVRRALTFARTERYDRAEIRAFDVESAPRAQGAGHRVRLVRGDFLPLTRAFFPGKHHHKFAERACAALEATR